MDVIIYKCLRLLVSKDYSKEGEPDPDDPVNIINKTTNNPLLV